MDGLNTLALLITLGCLLLACLALVCYWLAHVRRPLALRRHAHNPILSPREENWWESEAVFNPGAFVHNGRVHLLYRALGRDGISRVGYASSADGVTFDERPNHPAYDPEEQSLQRARESRAAATLSYETLTYDTGAHGSGGGWGGSEDPRAVILDGAVRMTFTSFEGWNNERIATTALPLEDLEHRAWKWKRSAYLSAPGEVQKNWLLFPEKIGGKYAVLHNIDPKIEIAYVDDLDALDKDTYIKSTFTRPETPGRWDVRVRGAGTPPIKTEAGWLLFYHGYNPNKGPGYQVGAMLLDLEDPARILYRSQQPVLTPDEWYENHWKPGVVYASGAVVFNNELFVYYGGGDKYVAAAKADLRDFLRKLTTYQHATLEPVQV